MAARDGEGEIPLHVDSLAAGCPDGGLQRLRHQIPAGERRQRSSRAAAAAVTVKSN